METALHQQLPVGRVRHTGDLAESIPLAAVVPPLQSLVRHAARNRERITITDQHQPAAVVISADELEDLEDALAIAEARLREASGDSRRIPHAEVRRRLGLQG
jgi:PHD/YefM family antitoxin component YafN of YafNO toxin-antitoxin module